MARKKLIPDEISPDTFIVSSVSTNGALPERLSVKHFIDPLPTDLGREDLNQIAKKVNEIIDGLNS